MKLFIQSPDARGTIDPPVHKILRQIPGIVESAHEADIVLVPITRLPDFKFNPEIHRMHKPWVLVDFVELGWEWDQRQSHFWGQNSDDFKCFDSNRKEWGEFDCFVGTCPPDLVLMRELLKKDVSERVQPIDYLCYGFIPPPQRKEQFDARPIQILNYWGRSSEHRMDLHGKFFQRARTALWGGYEVVTQFDHIRPALQNLKGAKLIASIHTPWYARTLMELIFSYQELAKVSVAMPGDGVKTFRDAEASINAVMAKPADNLARAYPWDDSNSLVLPFAGVGDPASKIWEESHLLALYDIYVAGIQNACRYTPDHYVKNHILPKLEAIL